jgi:hypothetical protein
MDRNCQLEIFDEDSIEFIISGKRGTIYLPYDLYDAKVTRFIPGIVTMIFIKN